MACVVSILSRGICDEMALVDVVTDKVKGEVWDLQHGACWLANVHVVGGDDFAVSAGSTIVVITAGARQNVGESRLSLCQRNVEIFKKIVPQVAKYSPKAIIIVISNPVDVMTYVAWKLSGFPPERVFGTGTSLDTSRFRHMIGERLGVGPSEVDAFVIGEHGDSSVPVWSSANVSGVPIGDFSRQCELVNFESEFGSIHKKVVEAAMDIIKLKGYTNWGIGLTCAGIVRAILRNERSVHPLSTLIKDLYSLPNEVFVSVPCIISARGIRRAVRMKLSEEESTKFMESADQMWSVCAGLKL